MILDRAPEENNNDMLENTKKIVVLISEGSIIVTLCSMESYSSV